MSRNETTTPNSVGKLSSLAAIRKLTSEFGEYAVLSEEAASCRTCAASVTFNSLLPRLALCSDERAAHPTHAGLIMDARAKKS
jgi:hypothetical protein